jgi:hypothetical protein
LVRQRPLQTRFALDQHGSVLTSLGEQRGEHRRAERHADDAGLCQHDAVVDREIIWIAEMTDAKGYRPDDCQRSDECGYRGEDRSAAHHPTSKALIKPSADMPKR